MGAYTKKLYRVLASKSGFSLVEVLASIVILGLIVGPFLSMFIQSARTNDFTEKVSDATYIANTQMEHLYKNISSRNKPTQLTAEIVGEGFTLAEHNTSENSSRFTKETDGHFISVKLKPAADGALEDVIVQVYKTANMDHIEAQMESIYSWKE